MPYLNLDQNYFEHLKSKRLRLKFGEMFDVVPLRLWCHAAKHHPKDGVFKGYSDEELALLAGNGKITDATGMLLALLELQFLEKTPEGWYKVHEWEEHQGHIIAFKERGKNNAKKRWDLYRENHKENASSITISNAKNKTGNAPTNLTNQPTKKNNSVFTPPTVEQVKEYCKEKGYEEFNCQNFIDFNEARGWMLGKNKIKDWKATVRTARNNAKSYKDKNAPVVKLMEGF